MNLQKRLEQKSVIILDGALGTELQRRGVKTKLPLWSAEALLENPKLVQEIHEDYIGAGAEIITANTFRTNVRTIKKAGIKEGAKALTNLAVKLAQEAVWKSGKRVFVAGSIAPVEDCYLPNLVPNNKELKSEHQLLANYLKKAGVDLILVETMNTIREALIATKASEKTHLPILVSFVVDRNGRLLSGESLKSAVEAINQCKIDGVLVNCIRAENSLKILKILLNATKLPVGIYANGIGKPGGDLGWKFIGKETIKEYAAYARKWIKMGAKIVGGCCGTTPDYIKRISQFRNTGT